LGGKSPKPKNPKLGGPFLKPPKLGAKPNRSGPKKWQNPIKPLAKNQTKFRGLNSRNTMGKPTKKKAGGHKDLGGAPSFKEGGYNTGVHGGRQKAPKGGPKRFWGRKHRYGGPTSEGGHPFISGGHNHFISAAFGALCGGQRPLPRIKKPPGGLLKPGGTTLST